LLGAARTTTVFWVRSPAARNGAGRRALLASFDPSPATPTASITKAARPDGMTRGYSLHVPSKEVRGS